MAYLGDERLYYRNHYYCNAVLRPGTILLLRNFPVVSPGTTRINVCTFTKYTLGRRTDFPTQLLTIIHQTERPCSHNYIWFFSTLYLVSLLFYECVSMFAVVPAWLNIKTI